jgi:hypothetical protein
MSTSGSSGRTGLFVYDAAGWAAYVAQFLRVTALADLPIWEHRGMRVGVVTGSDPRHVSAQVASPDRRPAPAGRAVRARRCRGTGRSGRRRDTNRRRVRPTEHCR